MSVSGWRITCSANVRRRSRRSASASHSGEVVSTTTRRRAPPERSRHQRTSSSPSPCRRADGWMSPVAVRCPLPSRYTDAAATRSPVSSRPPMDSPDRNSLRSIGSPARSGRPPSASRQRRARWARAGRSASESGCQARVDTIVLPQRPAARSAVRISGHWSGSRARDAAKVARDAGSPRRFARLPLVEAHLHVRREDRDEEHRPRPSRPRGGSAARATLRAQTSSATPET